MSWWDLPEKESTLDPLRHCHVEGQKGRVCNELPEEKIRLSDGIVRLQAGTNKYDSQKVRIFPTT
ncbi:hypothetical protein ANCDUO_09590 [Ancylostoma duodenale]|uniref:Uncharacterized protein n=1 Tax=Ancylostoma duodenale TaxID=51022 RepID=A0A0C2DCJ6_9BILA|nr:hypothetical protein ANCDUO_09590 [Ancylostoma duodenale]